MSSTVLIDQLDSAIDVLLSDDDAAIPNVDLQVERLLGITAELRTLPRPDFRGQLRLELMHQAGSNVQPELGALHALESKQRRRQFVDQQQAFLPMLLEQGKATYPVHRSNFAISLAAHVLALVLAVTSGLWLAQHRQFVAESVMLVSPEVSDYLPFSKTPETAAGGGGGGDRDKLSAPQGRLPKTTLDQITPPETVVRNDNPKLPMEPTVVVPPQVKLADNGLPNLGDPRSRVLGPPSNGIGAGSGLGSGKDGGIGSGAGGGVGPGVGGGYGGGIFRVGGGVSAPRPIYKPEPEYSTEARQAKYQGTVVVSLVVGADGLPRQLHVAQSLGMGLDEKALEAVRQWRFEPAMKDGRPVPVAVDVEVTFHLF